MVWSYVKTMYVVYLKEPLAWHIRFKDLQYIQNLAVPTKTVPHFQYYVISSEKTNALRYFTKDWMIYSLTNCSHHCKNQHDWKLAMPYIVNSQWLLLNASWIISNKKMLGIDWRYEWFNRFQLIGTVVLALGIGTSANYQLYLLNYLPMPSFTQPVIAYQVCLPHIVWLCSLGLLRFFRHFSLLIVDCCQLVLLRNWASSAWMSSFHDMLHTMPPKCPFFCPLLIIHTNLTKIPKSVQFTNSIFCQLACILFIGPLSHYCISVDIT